MNVCSILIQLDYSTLPKKFQTFVRFFLTRTIVRVIIYSRRTSVWVTKSKEVSCVVLRYRGVTYQCSWFKFLFHLLIIVSVLLVMISFVSNIARANMPEKTITFTVHKGDTLWSLAKQIAPDADPRQTINIIKTQNHLPSSELIAGQQLHLVINRD